MLKFRNAPKQFKYINFKFFSKNGEFRNVSKYLLEVGALASKRIFYALNYNKTITKHEG
jgi:hypothetical protein